MFTCSASGARAHSSGISSKKPLIIGRQIRLSQVSCDPLKISTRRHARRITMATYSMCVHTALSPRMTALWDSKSPIRYLAQKTVVSARGLSASIPYPAPCSLRRFRHEQSPHLPHTPSRCLSRGPWTCRELWRSSRPTHATIIPTAWCCRIGTKAA